MNSTCEGDYVEWIYKYFNDCISTPREKVSFAIGSFSNILWLVCSVPQIYHNCRSRHVESFSPFYFILICTADVLSLIGGLIVKVNFTQVLTGFIYVALDITLLTQYAIYHKRAMNNEAAVDDINQELSPTKQHDSDIPIMGIAPLMPILAASIDYSIPYTKDYLYGSLSGWMSFFIYTVSRIIQLRKNIKQRVLTDYSHLYVAILVTANATYSTSIFTKSLDEEYLWKQTPWILGSLVPMTFDIITAIQLCVCKQSDYDHARDVM